MKESLKNKSFLTTSKALRRIPVWSGLLLMLSYRFPTLTCVWLSWLSFAAQQYFLIIRRQFEDVCAYWGRASHRSSFHTGNQMLSGLSINWAVVDSLESAQSIPSIQCRTFSYLHDDPVRGREYTTVCKKNNNPKVQRDPVQKKTVWVSKDTMTSWTRAH